MNRIADKKTTETETQAPATTNGTAVGVPFDVKKQHEQQGAMVLRWQVAAQLVATSVSDDDPQKRAKVSKLKLTADKQLIDIAGAELPVVEFVAHAVELANAETGEVKEAIRIVLLLADGTTVSTCSEPFMNSFAQLANQMGKGPWEPPLRLATKAVRSKKNPGAYLECWEAFDPEPAKAKVIDPKRK